MLDLDKNFKQIFPALAEKFSLSNIQKDAINNILYNGNTLCIMPTGSGKSLIYWLAGVLSEGITIVISPLIALIDEQTDKLTEQNIDVLTIHGGIDSKKQEKLLVDFANKKINPKFIFASPEKIATDGLFEHCISHRKDDINLLVIDEVHCVSQWGISFRPFYKRIPDFMNCIYNDSQFRPKTLALTATLNPKELIDICSEFEIEKSNIIKHPFLSRAEISLKILRFSNEKEKEEKLWDIIKIHKNEKILIYVYRIRSERGVEKLSERASEKGYKSICFHGDMTSNERRDIIAKFKNNEINVIFATNAFGMGIDIPDIRVVVHYMIPESVEQYYQEIGRASRDGNGANAYLLFSYKNIDVKRSYFIDGSFPNEEELRERYKKMGGQGLGLHTFPYFEDEEIQQCFTYYLYVQLLKIVCKGFSDLKNLKDINEKELQDIINCTVTKNLITTVRKSKVDVKSIIDIVYESIISGKANTTRPLDRRLIVDVLEQEISEAKMALIQSDINEKKSYKNGLLDYLVYLATDNISSNEMHQEIARYLGADKHTLNRIYTTEKGDLVRSKSEVIIANLLFSYGINYEYEKKLFYEKGKWIEPDFTITLPDRSEIYWEHLGMLGVEDYDTRWLEKQEIYEKYYDGMLTVTYEGTRINDNALSIIKNRFLFIEER